MCEDLLASYQSMEQKVIKLKEETDKLNITVEYFNTSLPMINGFSKQKIQYENILHEQHYQSA